MTKGANLKTSTNWSLIAHKTISNISIRTSFSPVIAIEILTEPFNLLLTLQGADLMSTCSFSDSVMTLGKAIHTHIPNNFTVMHEPMFDFVRKLKITHALCSDKCKFIQGSTWILHKRLEKKHSHVSPPSTSRLLQTINQAEHQYRGFVHVVWRLWCSTAGFTLALDLWQSQIKMIHNKSSLQKPRKCKFDILLRTIVFQCT